jgi:alcohol dehydrogenase YqhD (iron-dependent ADH family)
MLNFQFHNPTKIIFGKDSLNQLGDEVIKYGQRVLVVTGGQSVKKIGLYDKVIKILKNLSCHIFELEGINPNPRLHSVHEGIKICKNNNVDFILAVGGGSVIDAAKAIAAGAKTDIDIWEYYIRKHTVTQALPLGTILTLAATGTEMNGNSVVTNWETKEKLPISSEHLFPVFSILDPELTFSVPKDHTVNGCIDIMVHVFEQYFSKTQDTPLQDRFCESILKTVIENTPKVMEDPMNYEARANIMWCGTMALNTLLEKGKSSDWASHNIEHEVSAFYDIAHGAGLSIITPNWMKYVLSEGTEIFKQYAQRVWDVDSEGKTDEQIALEGIARTQAFFKEIGAPITLREVGIDDSNIELMAERAVRFGAIGGYKKLYKEDVLNILQMSL